MIGEYEIRLNKPSNSSCHIGLQIRKLIQPSEYQSQHGLTENGYNRKLSNAYN